MSTQKRVVHEFLLAPPCAPAYILPDGTQEVVDGQQRARPNMSSAQIAFYERLLVRMASENCHADMLLIDATKRTILSHRSMHGLTATANWMRNHHSTAL
jgi:hypothetical protein